MTGLGNMRTVVSKHFGKGVKSRTTLNGTVFFQVVEKRTPVGGSQRLRKPVDTTVKE